MVYTSGSEIKYSILKLESTALDKAKHFQCGNSEIDSYLQDRANKDDGTVTYLFIDDSDGSILAFASICCSGIRRIHVIDGTEYALTSSAIEIKYFAVREDLHHFSYDASETGEEYFLSDDLFISLMQICKNISENHIAAEFVILYSVPKKVKFYERNHFGLFETYMQKDNHAYIKDCVPMFMGLFN